MTEVLLFDGLRSPFGRYAGALATLRPDDLLAQVLRTLLARQPAECAGLIEDIIMGATNQAGEDCRNVARMAGLLAGVPVQAGGQTVNRLCGSGLAAVVDAARAVRCGEGDLLLAGGVESMSRAPLVMGKAEQAFARDARLYDSTIGSRFLNPRLVEQFGDDSMPQTAENIAAELNLSRAACDAFAAASQRKYHAALDAGFYADEIAPVTLPARRRQPALEVRDDEQPRSGTSLEGLAALSPLQEGGVVTAGNASSVNDGAAALLLGSPAAAQGCGLRPRARWLGAAVSGISPRVMGLGPVDACRKVLQRSALTLAQMDVIELNEAFAAQVLGCLQLLELDAEDPRLNPNGGAIAIGHPLGASGARLLLTAMRQLERCRGRYALVSLCIGMGQGIAVLIERVDGGEWTL